jgi:adenine-specific DNA methylase
MNAPATLGMNVADYERMMAYDANYRMEEEARRVIMAHPVNNAYNTVIGVDIVTNKPVIQQEYFEEQLKDCMKMMQRRFPEITQKKRFIMKTITPWKSKYGYDPSM